MCAPLPDGDVLGAVLAAPLLEYDVVNAVLVEELAEEEVVVLPEARAAGKVLGRPKFSDGDRDKLRTALDSRCVPDALSAPAVRVALGIQWYASAAYPQPPAFVRAKSQISRESGSFSVYR